MEAEEFFKLEIKDIDLRILVRFPKEEHGSQGLVISRASPQVAIRLTLNSGICFPRIFNLVSRSKYWNIELSTYKVVCSTPRL